ncbi:pentatricopeptide repeat-containing protein At2g20710, mitochondrial-like [Herrania umbratica]|uniref:Pentatricopeptide repeat-containing protein At2g20710, mitochondrial-like n=1 Tax=Herrania umbratica TaxID=108875 RepID=A0A6J1BMX1_9ROSI|nr:pentatricopeptide repeat-containing protein At2g20710, mitochondrial-like [Herrania umbratica]
MERIFNCSKWVSECWDDGESFADAKEDESVMPLQRRKLAFEFLLNLYAKTNNKNELYRVRNAYKPSYVLVDTSCCHMITALAQLDDLDGAEKIFGEWELQCTIYDLRADSVVNSAERGRTPYASTWNVLAMGFMEHNQMPKAVKMLKKAMSVGRRGWRPSSMVFAARLEYLEEQGDGRGMEEMVCLLKNSGPLTRDMYHSLLRCRIKTVSEIVDQMKMDGFDADKETHKILESVPSLLPHWGRLFL